MSVFDAETNGRRFGAGRAVPEASSEPEHDHEAHHGDERGKRRDDHCRAHARFKYLGGGGQRLAAIRPAAESGYRRSVESEKTGLTRIPRKTAPTVALT